LALAGQVTLLGKHRYLMPQVRVRLLEELLLLAAAMDRIVILAFLARPAVQEPEGDQHHLLRLLEYQVKGMLVVQALVLPEITQVAEEEEQELLVCLGLAAQE
jgi:hypothetical protein